MYLNAQAHISVSELIVPICTPPAVCEIYCSTSLPIPDILLLLLLFFNFNFSHSARYATVSHCGLIFAFPYPINEAEPLSHLY